MENPSKLINQTSGCVEYFTPQPIIEAARYCMGDITLDPASSRIANERVGASIYFDESIDGLSLTWAGKVWLNHPFGRKNNPLWINKLVSEFEKGNVKQACCITYACTSEKWFAPLFSRPMCFLQPRTNYILPDGTLKKGVTKGSVVTYFGPDDRVDWFCENFKKLGVIKL